MSFKSTSHLFEGTDKLVATKFVDMTGVLIKAYPSYTPFLVWVAPKTGYVLVSVSINSPMVVPTNIFVNAVIPNTLDLDTPEMYTDSTKGSNSWQTVINAVEGRSYNCFVARSSSGADETIQSGAFVIRYL
jgi:hypothetical protein